MHPWHELSPGNELPNCVQAIIEIPRGSKAKYEIDKTSGFLKLDRVLTTALHYPINYGFIPQTYAGDHDPLDILVFSQIDLPPLTLVNAKIIGVMRMIDKEEMDDKIIAVACTDIAVNHIENLDQFPEFILNEIHRFFEDYKKQGNLNPVLIPQLLGKPEAVVIIEEALSEYQKLFLNGKRI